MDARRGYNILAIALHVNTIAQRLPQVALGQRVKVVYPSATCERHHRTIKRTVGRNKFAYRLLAAVARLHGFTGNTSLTPVPEAFVDTSGVILTHLDSINGTPSQAKVGDLIYGGTGNTDDMDLQASGNTDPIGWMIRYTSATDVDVQLFTPTEFLAQQTA